MIASFLEVDDACCDLCDHYNMRVQMKVPKLRLGHLDHSVYEKGRFRGLKLWVGHLDDYV
jgi:hypothetical protein